MAKLAKFFKLSRPVICLVGFPFVLSLNFLAEAAADSSCTYSNMHEVSMPPQRDQGDSPYCYGFAAVSLIQQLYCSKKAGGCKYSSDPDSSDDRLSVLDTLGGDGRGYSASDDGEAIQLLRIVGKRGTLAKESCASFESYTSAATANHKRGWQSTLFNDLESLDGKSHHVSDCELAMDIQASLGLPGDLPSIIEILHSVEGANTDRASFQKSLAGAMSRLTFPDHCLATRISLPSYRVKTMAADLDASSFKSSNIQAQLLRLIAQGIPVGTNMCAKLGCAYGMHASVIVGDRLKRCPGHPDVVQLKFYDSLGYQFAYPPGQPWADFSSVFSMLDENRQQTKEFFDHGINGEMLGPNTTKEDASPLYWIENK